MNKHTSICLVAGWLALCFAAPCVAQSATLANVSNADAINALRTALTQGASKAVAELGQQDGFMGNPDVRIPLPPALAKIDRKLRRFGLTAQADQLVLTMNRAAEAAVPQARELLVGAVKSMTIADAKTILTGGEDSATRYFRDKTEQALALKFKPIVAQATAKVDLARSYNSFAGTAAQMGLIDAKTANLDDYITSEALDGLFTMIAAEERAIRRDPVGQTSRLLQRVFELARPSTP